MRIKYELVMVKNHYVIRDIIDRKVQDTPLGKKIHDPHTAKMFCEAMNRAFFRMLGY